MRVANLRELERTQDRHNMATDSPLTTISRTSPVKLIFTPYLGVLSHGGFACLRINVLTARYVSLPVRVVPLRIGLAIEQLDT
jgi:hypothetical protein